ncbi:AMP-binding protein [Nocardioides sp.]|uniref:AMP-binding protein n=1 Tax=Nocardioides sp. TaxID=35761 RepID=UPI002F3E4885
MTIDPVVIDKRPRSLLHMFRQRVEDTPDEDAFYYPVEGGWQESSWGHTNDLVVGLAAGLLALEVEPQDRVAIIASTRYEWVLGYLAILWTGAAVTAVDPTADDDTIAQVLADSGARIVLAEDYDLVQTLWRVRARIRDVTKVVQIDGDFPDDRVITLEGLLGLGHDHLVEQPRALSQRLYAVRRQGLAALPYARDQRGNLRGVRLSHAALTYQAAAVAALGELTRDDLLYVALPLSTAYAQAMLGIQLACGFPIALEGRADSVVTSISAVRPTFVAATPAMLDRVRTAIEDARQPSLFHRRRWVEKKVRTDVGETFGDRLRFVVCAGGIDADLADFYELAGITVLEAYGRPETAGAVSVARPGEAGSRTAGLPLVGTEVRISDEGEIEVAGPGLMDGYHGRRADTEAVLDQGWLRTGDAGLLDEEGRLLVFGRHVPPET